LKKHLRPNWFQFEKNTTIRERFVNRRFKSLAVYGGKIRDEVVEAVVVEVVSLAEVEVVVVVSVELSPA